MSWAIKFLPSLLYIFSVVKYFSYVQKEKNTSAEYWFIDLKNGKKDPGKVSLAQNLSNLIRLAILYKYDGIYFDTDFIILKEFSILRNFYPVGFKGCREGEFNEDKRVQLYCLAAKELLSS